MSDCFPRSERTELVLRKSLPEYERPEANPVCLFILALTLIAGVLSMRSMCWQFTLDAASWRRSAERSNLGSVLRGLS